MPWPRRRCHGYRQRGGDRGPPQHALSRELCGWRGGGTRDGPRDDGHGRGGRRGAPGDAGVRPRNREGEDPPWPRHGRGDDHVRPRGAGGRAHRAADARQGPPPPLRRHVHHRPGLPRHVAQRRHEEAPPLCHQRRRRRRAQGGGDLSWLRPLERALSLPRGGGAPRRQLQCPRPLRLCHGPGLRLRRHSDGVGRRSPDAAGGGPRGLRQAGRTHCACDGPHPIHARAGAARGGRAQALRRAHCREEDADSDQVRRHCRAGHHRRRRQERDHCPALALWPQEHDVCRRPRRLCAVLALVSARALPLPRLHAHRCHWPQPRPPPPRLAVHLQRQAVALCPPRGGQAGRHLCARQGRHRRPFHHAQGQAARRQEGQAGGRPHGHLFRLDPCKGRGREGGEEGQEEARAFLGAEAEPRPRRHRAAALPLGAR
mmetsp:Transcript_16402/g.64012  ORF Transcript_16402/g.64012 Transcript_16402/m.64012 type:complete len:429 (-) Transcript_16402:279-1565(-)